MIRRYPSPRATAMRFAFAAAILAAGLCSGSPARADFDVRIDIGNAPPPPRFVFHARPHERYLAEERVYVVDDPQAGDDDIFNYDGYYWVFSRGYWYRSYRWAGPYRVIHPRYVPAVFYRVPPGHWKHRPKAPPAGIWRQEPQGRRWKDDRGQDKGHEKDHDKGHDHGRH